MSRFWVKQTPLQNVGGPHPLTRRPKGKGSFASRQPLGSHQPLPWVSSLWPTLQLLDVPTAWANSWKKSLPLFICTPVGSIFPGKVRLIEMLMIYMLKTHKTVYGHTGIWVTSSPPCEVVLRLIFSVHTGQSMYPPRRCRGRFNEPY